MTPRRELPGTPAAVSPRRPSAALPSSKPTVVLLLACLVFAAWVGTQVVAFRLGYQRNLGPWAYAPPPEAVRWWRAGAVLLAGAALVTMLRGRAQRFGPAVAVACLAAAIGAGIVSLGPVYAPYRGVLWAVRYQTVAAVAPVTYGGLLVMMGALLVVLAMTFAARPSRARRAPSTSHGSAAWDDGADLLGPALGGTGVAIGRPLTGMAPVPARAARQTARSVPSVLRFGDEGHLLTVAPTRSGKGVGAVIPNLLTYPGSVLVTDPKGENYAVTRAQRQALGQEVIALDPFEITDAPRLGFNPLDMIDPAGPDVSDDAMLLADMLVVADFTGGGGEAGFWDNEARALIAGFILYVAVKERGAAGTRTLPQVRRLLTLPPAEFRDVLEQMQACARDRTPAGELIARAATRQLQKAGKEQSGVISTAQSHTHFLDSPRMVAVLSSSGHAGSALSLDRLKTELVSLFLVLPAERLSTYRRWLRLMIGCGLLAMTRTRTPPRHRVLFLLDEFANLGRMGPVEDAISLVGGFGVTFWLILQDLSQLKAHYRDRWETFEGSAQVLQAFGTNDLFTAKHLSERIGDATILVESENLSAGISHGRTSARNQSAAQTVSEKGRRLLTADEVMRLPADQQLLLVRGRRPIRARKLNYLMDPEFAGLAAENPLYGSSYAASTSAGQPTVATVPARVTL